MATIIMGFGIVEFDKSSNEPLSVKRCELEACAPDKALEECFLIRGEAFETKETKSDTAEKRKVCCESLVDSCIDGFKYIVDEEVYLYNLGYGDIIVEHLIDKNRGINICDEEQWINIRGNASIKVDRNRRKIYAYPGELDEIGEKLWEDYDGCYLALKYSIGDIIALQPGDKVYNGSKLLLEYKKEIKWEEEWEC